jgi:hypothetical protein
MPSAATLTHMGMAEIYEALPHYHTYFKRHAANADETSFRLALGQQFEGMGNRLLDGVEIRPHLLSQEQHQIIDMMTDDITTILKLLNRTGVIRLADEPEVAIPTLRGLDQKLIMLLEFMWSCTEEMFEGGVDDFQRTATNMAAGLAHFLEVAEDRNAQLGLGWESEFSEFEWTMEPNEEDF